MGVNFGADDSSAWGLMGYVGGIAKTVQTPVYINAVVAYTHARLANFFDEYFDKIAEAAPSKYGHMYEWPSTWHAYSETVGNPEDRLWEHTLSGNGRNRTASFIFLPSGRPTPVDPILLEEGPGGVVKEGVHIFVWKAEAFEYGMPITVKPTLAKFLAYVGRDTSSGGHDEGWHHANQNDGSPNMVNLSEGPVHFTAGGGLTTMAFSTQFVLWFQTLAGDAFDSRIAPELSSNLINQSKMNAAIRIGKNKSKPMSITAQASRSQAVFDEAMASGIAEMESKATGYIRRAAAARRAKL